MTELPKLPFDLAGKRVYVAGHKGMVGAALVRRLGAEACQILTVDRTALDLTHQANTDRWINRTKPHVVIVAAAKSAALLTTIRTRSSSCPIISPSR